VLGLQYFALHLRAERYADGLPPSGSKKNNDTLLYYQDVSGGDFVVPPTREKWLGRWDAAWTLGDGQEEVCAICDPGSIPVPVPGGIVPAADLPVVNTTAVEDHQRARRNHCGEAELLVWASMGIDEISCRVLYTSSCLAGRYYDSGTMLTWSCPPGFFCPANFQCPIKCVDGSYCPLSTLVVTPTDDDGAADPAGLSNSTLSCTYPNGTGHDTLLGPFTEDEIHTAVRSPQTCAGSYVAFNCPDGHFCETTTSMEVCPRGSFCPAGVVAPIKCSAVLVLAGACNNEGQVSTEIAEPVYYVLFGALVVTLCASRLVGGARAAARVRRQRHRARKRWHWAYKRVCAKRRADKLAASEYTRLSMMFQTVNHAVDVAAADAAAASALQLEDEIGSVRLSLSFVKFGLTLRGSGQRILSDITGTLHAARYVSPSLWHRRRHCRRRHRRW